jgi:serine/threonine protein kinase
MGAVGGRYELTRLLGRGGAGEAWLAKDLREGAPVVVKLLRLGRASSARDLERFRREVLALRKLAHPHVVEFLDAGTCSERSQPYYVMRWSPGVTLAELLRSGHLGLQRALRLVDQLLSALEFGHSQGVLHRDLKPGNLLVEEAGTPRERLRLLDFGLAKHLSGGDRTLEQLTHEGGMGTPLYLAPEQCLARPTGPRTDVYAVGCLLLTLLSGRPPFEGENASQVLVGHCRKPPPRLDERVPGAPAGLAEVVDRCLAKTPEERPSAVELRALLAPFGGARQAEGQGLPHVRLHFLSGSCAGRSVTFHVDERRLVGSSVEATLRLEGSGAAPTHALLALTPEGLWVTDLGGGVTLLSGVRLPPWTPCLALAQDTLELGGEVIALELAGPADPRRMGPVPGRAPSVGPLPAGASEPGEPATPAEGPRVRDVYERTAQLGEGAAGLVFAARHRETGQEVAIKVLRTRVEAGVRERFLREAAVRVESPHVVQTLEVHVEQGQPFIVMELVRGQSGEELVSGGPLPIQQALAICEQAARGLEAAHQAGVIHRDIKPANILVTHEGLAKLGDFGIAKRLGAARELTQTGQGMGTLAYVAPEQAEDAKRVDPAADLYSLGATLYHFLTGRPPFLPSPEILNAIFDEDPPPVRSLRPDCPPEVEKLTQRLLEKEPGDRLPSASALAHALGQLRASL